MKELALIARIKEIIENSNSNNDDIIFRIESEIDCYEKKKINPNYDIYRWWE